MTQSGDFSVGHVGGPFSCTEICLKDVPEMGYRHTDTWHGGDPRDAGGGGEACEGRGEVCVTGVGGDLVGCWLSEVGLVAPRVGVSCSWRRSTGGGTPTRCVYVVSVRLVARGG